jgi:GNAT superfamily N-acetyltransferase
MDMEIIAAREKHIPEIVELWEEFAHFHEPFDPRYPMKDDLRTGYEIHLREVMAAKDTRVLAALEQGKLVGYAIAQIRKSTPVWRREKYGYIDEMAVTAACRRGGIGTQLLKSILDWFRSENLDMIELSVAAKNKVGYSFWRKHGFRDYLHHLYLKP